MRIWSPAPVAFAVLATTSPASARPDSASAASIPADSFDVSGGGLHVTYVASGPDGQSHLDYVSADRDLSFTGSQIRTVTAPDVGNLVSVTIWHTVDTGAVSFTLVIPPVRLPKQDAEVTVEVLGITTAHRFSVNPRLRRGQLASYAEVTLTGTARAMP